MKKTRIDWCDSTWNPVTGCLHGCEYCYARKIANRFGGGYEFVADVQTDKNGKEMLDAEGMPIFERLGAYPYEASGECHVLKEPADENDAHTTPHWREENYGEKPKKYPYPWYFDPTFHQYRLNEPRGWKKPRTIFVCSMADLFGDWVPDIWIKDVFDACEKASQHRYLFLTKNPSRYSKLKAAGILKPRGNWWFGSSTTDETASYAMGNNTFVSVEPILKPFENMWEPPLVRWVIIGAETGNRKDKVIPEKWWIDQYAAHCRDWRIPVFMKESLRELMGDDFRQEFPWEV